MVLYSSLMWGHIMTVFESTCFINIMVIEYNLLSPFSDHSRFHTMEASAISWATEGIPDRTVRTSAEQSDAEWKNGNLVIAFTKC